jgi:hypothetical protein
MDFISQIFNYELMETITYCTIVGLNPDRGKRFFSPPNLPDRLWGPPSLLFGGHRGSFPDANLRVRDVDHSPLSHTEVKNGASTRAGPAVHPAGPAVHPA